MRDTLYAYIKERTSIMEKLIWTKTTPTQVGWYWKRDTTSKYYDHPEIVSLRNYAGELAIGNVHLKGWYGIEKWEWAGPIPIPDETA